MPDAPQITRFTVDPPGQITLGQCVTVRWAVKGNVDDVVLMANDIVLWLGAPTKGRYEDCPTAAGRVTYSLKATGPGGTSQASETINVVDSVAPRPRRSLSNRRIHPEPEQPTATPEPEQPTATPEPTSGAEPPVIYSFVVNPLEVETGQTVTVTWRAGGGTTYTRILRNGVVVIDDAGFEGSVGVIVEAAGTYVLTLEAYNDAGDIESAEQTVIVTEPQ